MKETFLLPKVTYIVEKVSAVSGKIHPAVVCLDALHTREVRYALMVFTTRDRAAAWIAKGDDADQWKVYQTTQPELLRVLKAMLASGIGWFSLDDEQGPDEVKNIFGLLVDMEKE
jgi:hypothetical protein